VIYAIPNAEYERLESLGELSAIQREIASADEASLTKRLALGHLVQARDADRHSVGERDRCYCCGDEVTPFHWREERLCYFMHMSNADCIGSHPANPSGVRQSE